MTMTRRRFGAATLALGLAALPDRGRAGADAPVIAAASDLRYALAEIADAFVAATGQEVRLSFGSTGNFARQIRAGAPFQVFMAADERFALELARDGYARDQGTVYGEGRIVIAVPNGSALKADGRLDDLRRALSLGRVTRFAIANPDHAPYGMRAAEVLRHAGLWQALQPVMVLGENVSQAAQFALSGNTDGGLIAYSLALSPQLRPLGTFDLVPAGWHQPLRQRMVLLNGAGPVATAFYDHVRSSSVHAILARYGFGLPG